MTHPGAVSVRWCMRTRIDQPCQDHPANYETYQRIHHRSCWRHYFIRRLPFHGRYGDGHHRHRLRGLRPWPAGLVRLFERKIRTAKVTIKNSASISQYMNSSVPPVVRLAAMGFKKYGDWYLKLGQLECELREDAAASNVLYAFTTGTDVLYIGKTSQSLKKRLYGYQNPGGSQSTNIRGNAELKKLLSAGQAIEIYAFPDNGLLRYGGFHVNLAAGLEDDLIAELKPRWNITGI